MFAVSSARSAGCCLCVCIHACDAIRAHLKTVSHTSAVSGCGLELSQREVSSEDSKQLAMMGLVVVFSSLFSRHVTNSRSLAFSSSCILNASLLRRSWRYCYDSSMFVIEQKSIADAGEAS